MKKIIGLVVLIFISILNVSADDTWTWVINTAPVAVDDIATTNEWVTVNINVLWNDTDINTGTILTVSWVLNTINWVSVITASGNVLFTPLADFNWTWSFDYVVSDWVLTDTWHVVITVTPVNDLPVARDDKISTYRNTEKTFDPRINDTDVDWDILTIIWKTNWTYGTVSFTSTSVTYKPNQDFYGSDSFTYTISDWKWWTDVWTVKVTVIHTDYHDKPVQNVQKEFIGKFKELKNRYRHQMSSEDYKGLKNELRNEYLLRLKEVTWQWKQWEPQENEVNVKYKYQWNSYKIMYKNQYEVKYQNKISSFDDAKLKIVVWRIDTLINDVNTTWNDYSDSTKIKLNTMLLALRELILENMDDSDWMIDIDSLFE
jgi:hypothetical protein